MTFREVDRVTYVKMQSVGGIRHVSLADYLLRHVVKSIARWAGENGSGAAVPAPIRDGKTGALKKKASSL
jgi:hypothetical protein